MSETQVRARRPTSTSSQAPFALFAALSAPRDVLCEYRAEGDAAIDTSALPTSIDLYADCGGVVALSDVDDPLSMDQVTADLAVQAQRVYRQQMAALDRSGSPLALPRLRNAAQPVEVAIIDSSVTVDAPVLEPPSGPWLHGRAMGLAIHRLACPDGARTDRSECVVRFTSQQVLTEVPAYGHSKSVPGGQAPLPRWGYLLRLSDAINAAVDGFLARTELPGAPQRLVINLSVGYDPEWSLGEDGTVSPAHRKLEAALQRATCAGALVIAAAGNASYGLARDGNRSFRRSPMYPAGLMPVDDVLCPGGSRADRLVYAVGAVDERNNPVQNVRYDALSELSAMGAGVAFDNTTSPYDPDAPPLPRMTGSSFAAAGTSAVAAVVWSYLPALSPREVMDLIRDTGMPLGWQNVGRPSETPGPFFCFSEACMDGADRTSRQVFLCDALEEALGRRCIEAQEDDACAARDALAGCEGITPRYLYGRLDGFDLTTVERASQWAERPLAQLARAKPEECTYNGTHYGDPAAAPTRAEAWCPDDVLTNHTTQPFTLHSAPGRDGCSTCLIDATQPAAIFYAGLDPALRARITSSTLTVAGVRYLLGGALAAAPATLRSSAADGAPEILKFELPVELSVPPGPDASSGWSHQAELAHELDGGEATAVSTVPVHF